MKNFHIESSISGAMLAEFSTAIDAIKWAIENNPEFDTNVVFSAFQLTSIARVSRSGIYIQENFREFFPTSKIREYIR